VAVSAVVVVVVVVVVLSSFDAVGHICLDGTSVAGIQGLRIYQLNIHIRLYTFIKTMTAFLSSFCCNFMDIPSYFAAHVLNGRLCLGTFHVEDGVHEHIREVVSAVGGVSCTFLILFSSLVSLWFAVFLCVVGCAFFDTRALA